MAEREAISLLGIPCDGESGVHYAVGKQYWRTVEGRAVRCGPVTRITITDDLPGLHCNMERVRVYDGDTLIYEAPLHSLEGVEYPHPVKSEEQAS